MNERYEIQRELKKFFEKITLDNCGHLLQNHINKTEEQLKNRSTSLDNIPNPW